MTKQWLMRRSVRRPVSRLTTAPISSSVWRLPFISASALPSRTSVTAVGGRVWLCGGIHDLQLRDVDAVLLRRRLDARARPDQDRRDQAQPLPRRSTAFSELSSHGWATAVDDRRQRLQRSISRRYFS